MTFTTRAADFIEDAYKIVHNKAANAPITMELNYRKLNIEIENDDDSTIWVKWGNYDCKFIDLPARAMATIADNI